MIARLNVRSGAAAQVVRDCIGRIHATACCLLVLIASGSDAADLLRRFPYPFSHLISFASDVDQQPPWHGAAIHRVINEEIGLPVSDSLWPQGASSDVSSLLVGGVDLNVRASGIDTHTTAGLLIREWHRGNVDTFHSWQDDNTPPLVQRLDKPAKLAVAATVIAIAPPPQNLFSYYYRHLRIYFDAPPPPDMYWRLIDGSGKSILVGVDQIKAGAAVKPALAKPPFIIEIIFGLPPDMGVAASQDAFDLLHLTKIEIAAPSCSKGCAAAVTRVDRDNFSRRAVALQLPWLEAFNMRPALLTSHGGWSLAQDFGSAGFSMTMKRERGSIYESPLVPNKIRGLGNDAAEYAYHGDLLRRLGITTVWTYARDSKHAWNRPVPPLSSSNAGFYNLIRTMTGSYRTGSLDDFLQDVRATEPRLKNVDLNDIYCARACGGDQGAVLGLLVALGLSQTEVRSHVDELWYTHFATGDDDFKRSIATPLRPSAVAAMRKLADRYYNFSGSIAAGQRVWVAPAGVVARYRIAYEQIAPHLSVDRRTSAVTINSWQDRVTGRVLPDPAAGTRDFHGLTVYVPDSGKATLTIAGQDTKSFTRNPADDTGLQSITIVDDSTPEVLLDELPLAANGKIEASGGKWREPGDPRSGAAAGNSFGTLSASGGDAVVRWKPAQLNLWNTTHLSLAYRKSAASDAPRGKLALEIELADGGIIAVNEDSAPRDIPARSQWIVPYAEKPGSWNRIVLAVSDLRWPETQLKQGQQRPALPIGRVREIRFGLIGAGAGEQLDIDTVTALRPNSNNFDPAGGRLVGGRVSGKDGKPAPSIMVQADLPGSKNVISTVTDKNGYYYFFRQPVGRVMKIAASSTGRLCAPLRGQLLQVRKDEAEIDIELSNCQ